jgi:hypothetical protein
MLKLEMLADQNGNGEMSIGSSFSQCGLDVDAHTIPVL